MRIKKNSRMLLLRFNNYKSVDFIQEHLKCIKKNSDCWMLKTGKRLPDTKLQDVFDGSGYIILRAPKKTGGMFYMAHCLSFYNGEPRTGMNYPQYYQSMIDDANLWMVDSLDGTWFNIDCIELIPESYIDNLYLISNNKKVNEVIYKTRSATMYVICDIELRTKEIV